MTIDGYYGEVTRLTARYLVLKGQDGTEAIIPNEHVITSMVINHSYTDRRVRVEIPIQVSYQSDVELALQLMEEAARGALARVERSRAARRPQGVRRTAASISSSTRGSPIRKPAGAICAPISIVPY